MKVKRTQKEQKLFNIKRKFGREKKKGGKKILT